MHKLLPFAVILLLVFAITAQNPLEAKDKDEFIQLKAELIVLQKQVRDLQESSDKNTGQVSTLLTQVVDGVSLARRDIGQTKEIVDRSLSDINATANNSSQQLNQFVEKINATNVRLERLEQQIKKVEAFFNPTTIIKNCDEGEQQYKQAYGDYIRGNYALAVEQFRNYVTCFSGTEAGGQAQYLIADSFYKQLEYQNAIPELDKLINEYPNNRQVATARYKKADCLLKTDKRKEAEAELRLVIQNHPSSPEAKQAEQVLASLPPEKVEPPKKPTPTRPRR
jgi:TolA-binding protein